MTQAITRSEEEQFKAATVRLEPGVYNILFKRAKKHTRSLNGEINSILKDYLAQLQKSGSQIAG